MPLIALGVLAACDGSATSSPGPPAGSPLADDRQTISTQGRSVVRSHPGIDVTRKLPICFLSSDTGDLEVRSDYGRHTIIRGHARVPRAKLADRWVERGRRVEVLDVSPGVMLVIVNVSRMETEGVYPLVLEATEDAPSLIDAFGERYLPVGFVYLDDSWAEALYEPGRVLSRLSEIPRTSRSRRDQHLWLIYRVSAGRSVKYLARGGQPVYEFNPPVTLDLSEGG
jgi:hypothetical protein